MESFKYNAIDLEGPAFRLIRLLKGDNDVIQCHLFDAWLYEQENIMDYVALSYTWGDAEKTYEIIVNGSRLAVTKNLYHALWYLRCQDQDRILWIDAICINQNDHRERGHQVQQMGSIYNKAERVVIWLGLPTYDTDLIMDFMKKLEEESLKHTCNNWKTSDQAWANIWSVIQAGFSRDLLDGQRGGLKSLLARSWFRRVWILQEVANARAAEIVCGTKSVSARIFALTPFLAGIVPDPHSQAVLDIMPGPSRKSSWWTQKRDLQTLLAKFGKGEASDPRDVIYALLGMSSDVSSLDSLKANYEKSVQEAIRDTTIFLLRIPNCGYPTHFPTWTLQTFLENLNSLGNPVLEWAVEMGYEAVVKVLVERDDVDINMKDKSDQTLLLKAVERGYEVIVRLLVDRGAAVDISNQIGDTALHMAALEGHEAIVRLLIDHGVAVDISSQIGETALYMAAVRGHEAIVQLLVGRGEAVDIKNQRGETVLLKPALVRPMARLPIDRGAAVDIKDRNRDTLLLQAVSQGGRRMVRALVDLGADINAKNLFGRTVLHQAVSSESNLIVRLLIGLGADINAKDQFGETPLYLAAFGGRQTMVQLLVDNGADFNTRSNDGTTALYRATSKGFKEIEQLLRSARASE